MQVVSLSFACENLPNLDTFTRTDGMVVLYKKSGTSWQKIGMTEVINDNLNPEWVKSFDVQYFFEKQEEYKVEVYDVDDENNLNNFANHDFAGSLVFKVHEVITARGQCLSKALVNPERAANASGVIKITGDEKNNNGTSEEVHMTVRAPFANGSDMNFFIVYKMMGPNQYRPLYKSEIQPVKTRPNIYEWNMITLGANELTGGDLERQIKIEFFSNQKSGKHSNRGQANFNYAELKEGKKEFDIVKANGDATKFKLEFSRLDITQRHSFLEYVMGGCEISLAIAIDFTQSNGNPSRADSLHSLVDL